MSLCLHSLCSCGTSAASHASGACGSVIVEESALLCKFPKLLSPLLWLLDCTEVGRDLGQRSDGSVENPPKPAALVCFSFCFVTTKLRNGARCHVTMRPAGDRKCFCSVRRQVGLGDESIINRKPTFQWRMYLKKENWFPLKCCCALRRLVKV